jgi:tagatose 1,6-diphosphate aldolase
MSDLGTGKARGLKRISDGEGRYGVLAVDQRPPIFDYLVGKLGITAEAAATRAGDVKRRIVRALGAGVSGVLLDPLYGLGPALPELPRETGLLVTLEDHAFERRADGHRLSGLIAGWDAERAVRVGADALKFLVWYRDDAPEACRRHQQDVVRRVGEACAQADHPFVLEILPYELPGETLDAFAEKSPTLHARAVETFAAPEYRVDLFKLALPGHVRGVTDWGGHHYSLADLGSTMRSTTDALDADWVLLSAGVSGPQFEQALTAALQAGARGYMAGRALWWAPLQSYPDATAMERELAGVRRGTLARLGELLTEHVPARPPEVGAAAAA